MDLRCDYIKHAELPEPGVIEFKCRSSRCGAGKGIVVLHKFDAVTGELLDTKRYKEPKGALNGAQHDPAAVRPA